jgi:hypothetical protein
MADAIGYIIVAPMVAFLLGMFVRGVWDHNMCLPTYVQYGITWLCLLGVPALGIWNTVSYYEWGIFGSIVGAIFLITVPMLIGAVYMLILEIRENGK